MSTMHVRLAALVAFVSFTGCAESTDVIQGGPSEAGAQDLAAVVMLATFNSAGPAPAPPAEAGGAAAAPYQYSAEFEGPVDCPLGGVVDVAAALDVSGDDATGGSTVQYSMTQVHDGCSATIG